MKHLSALAVALTALAAVAPADACDGVALAAPAAGYQTFSSSVSYHQAPVFVAAPPLRVVRREVLVPQAAASQVDAYSASLGAASYGTVGVFNNRAAVAHNRAVVVNRHANVAVNRHAAQAYAGNAQVNVNVSASGGAAPAGGPLRRLGRALTGGGGPKVKVKVKR